MRLIDAERFECISFQATGEQRYDDGFADGAMFISERIDFAPTIDAIPVEWLEEHDDEDIRDSDGNSYGRRKITVEEALLMWQKEQGAQNGTYEQI